jgi:aromatic ring-opening dioxygenase LigB subunit
LPLPLLVGGLLTRGRSRSFVVVDPATEATDCVEIGRDLAAAADRVALLVMGDGAARHDVKAPGYVDPRAPDWDRAVHDIFRSGDVSALEGLDQVLADELLCAGRAPWQVLAGAATGLALNTETATLTAPFGVGYHVARWAIAAGSGASTAKG